MQKSVLLKVLLLVGMISTAAHAQQTSKDNYTGTWEDMNSWEEGTVPATVNIDDADLELTINGFITRNGSLSFVANNENEDFVINDTLVIHGDLSFANKAANLRLSPNAVLIVFGNFAAENKIVVENGGVFIVTGDMDFSDSGHDDFSSPGDGELYVGGSVGGNDDAEDGEANWDDFGDEYPNLHDYVMCGGGPSCILPVTLTSFRVELGDNGVELSWTTTMEENFQKFIVQRSNNGIDFEDVGEVAGKGFDIYDIESKYAFQDKNPLTGFNYYRLKAVDLDNDFEYFPVKVIKVEAPKNVGVYPNPSSGEFISFSPNFSPEETDRIVLIDQLGVEILNILAPAGDTISFENKLDPGMYFLRYVSGDYEKVTRIVVKN